MIQRLDCDGLRRYTAEITVYAEFAPEINDMHD